VGLVGFAVEGYAYALPGWLLGAQLLWNCSMPSKSGHSKHSCSTAHAVSRNLWYLLRLTKMMCTCA
jgi:hypothetical protein